MDKKLVDGSEEHSRNLGFEFAHLGHTPRGKVELPGSMGNHDLH
jgi:hypothetical protein